MKDIAKKFRKTCEKCNKPFSTADESETLCRECRVREDFEKRRAADIARKEVVDKASEVFETRKCQDCGNEFVITNGERDFLEGHGYNLPLRCPDCRRLHRDYVRRGMDNIGFETTCVDCGAEMKFTNREMYWFVSHNYSIPTRCKDCRNKRNERFANRPKRITPKNDYEKSLMEGATAGDKKAVEPTETPVEAVVAEEITATPVTEPVAAPASVEEAVAETPVETAVADEPVDVIADAPAIAEAPENTEPAALEGTIEGLAPTEANA